MAVRKRRAQWSEVLATFEASGETLERFCARHRLSPRTLTWWRWRLRGERDAARAVEEVRLVAVDVPRAPVVSGGGDAIHIAVGALDLRIDVGTDVAYVAALVEALRPPRC